jgi:hypothetical protein
MPLHDGAYDQFETRDGLDGGEGRVPVFKGRARTAEARIDSGGCGVEVTATAFRVLALRIAGWPGANDGRSMHYLSGK